MIKILIETLLMTPMEDFRQHYAWKENVDGYRDIIRQNHDIIKSIGKELLCYVSQFGLIKFIPMLIEEGV